MNYRSQSSVHASQRYARSGAAYLRTLDVRKVFQIFVLYAFALVAAVACGQGFQPNSLGEASGEGQVTTVGEPAKDFKPKFGSAQRSDTETSTTIKVSVLDGTNVAVLSLVHNDGTYAQYANAVLNVGATQYHGNSYCADTECTEVAITVTRVIGSVTAQSAFLISAPVDGNAQMTAFTHDSRYDEAREALANLRRASNVSTSYDLSKD